MVQATAGCHKGFSQCHQRELRILFHIRSMGQQITSLEACYKCRVSGPWGLLNPSLHFQNFPDNSWAYAVLEALIESKVQKQEGEDRRRNWGGFTLKSLEKLLCFPLSFLSLLWGGRYKNCQLLMHRVLASLKGPVTWILLATCLKMCLLLFLCLKSWWMRVGDGAVKMGLACLLSGESKEKAVDRSWEKFSNAPHHLLEYNPVTCKMLPPNAAVS